MIGDLSGFNAFEHTPQKPAFPYAKRSEDVRISDRTEQGETIYIVVSNKTKEFYRLPEVEFAIFWNLDGLTSPENLKQKIEDLFPDYEFSVEELQALIDDFDRKWLLDKGRNKDQKLPGKNIWQELFYLRVLEFNPQSFLDWALPFIRFIWSPEFAITSIVFIAAAVCVAISRNSILISQAKEIIQARGLLFVILCFYGGLLPGFIHEFGHAFTCYYYGGRVEAMGVWLIYFNVNLFTDTSDLHFFRNKYHKIITGLAGVWFQYIFYFGCVLIWIFTPPHTVLYDYCVILIIVFTYGLLLYICNPFVKGDTYYVLGWLLDVTNMREQSFKHIGLTLQKTFLNLPSAKRELNMTPTRLKIIYTLYGTGATAYVCFILFLVWLGWVKFIFPKLGIIGIFLLMGGIAWGIWKWYTNAGGGLQNLLKNLRESPELQNIASTRLGRIGTTIGIVLLVLLIIPTRWGLSGPCTVRPAIRQALAPLESGVVLKVFKQEGDHIAKGEPFAQLDDFNLRRDLANLKIDELLAKERLSLLTAQYGSLLAKAQGASTEAQVAMEVHQLTSGNQLQAAKNAMDEAHHRYLSATARYMRLHADVARLKNGELPDTIAQASAILQKAISQRETARKELDRYESLEKENLVSSREEEQKQLAYSTASSDVLSLQAQLSLAKRNLARDAVVAYQDYQAAHDQYQAASAAYNQTLSTVEKTDPMKLQAEVTQTGQTLSFTKDQAIGEKVAFAELEAVRSRIKTDEEKLSRMTIRSPIDGIIMTPRVNELQGRSVSEGQAVAWVYQPGPMIFEIRMDELNISEVPTPQDRHNRVAVKLLALIGLSFSGKVEKIIPEGLTNPGGKSYLVDVAVNDTSGRLLPGMEGTGKVFGRFHPLLWQLVRRPVEYVLWKLWSLF